jgi:hypothetical protein
VNKLIEENCEQRAGNKRLENELFELCAVLEFVNRLRQEELRAPEAMKQNSLESLGSATAHKNER